MPKTILMLATFGLEIVEVGGTLAKHAAAGDTERQLDILRGCHALHAARPEVRLGRSFDPLILQAAMIDAGFVAVSFQVQVLHLGPALAGRQ